MEMNEKGTEPYKTEILSREGLLAAGCPKEAIHKILQEKTDGVSAGASGSTGRKS